VYTVKQVHMHRVHAVIPTVNICVTHFVTQARVELFMFGSVHRVRTGPWKSSKAFIFIGPNSRLWNPWILEVVLKGLECYCGQLKNMFCQTVVTSDSRSRAAGGQQVF